MGGWQDLADPEGYLDVWGVWHPAPRDLGEASVHVPVLAAGRKPKADVDEGRRIYDEMKRRSERP